MLTNMNRFGENGMAIEEWEKDFKEFISELQMPRDDYNGIMEYIDEGVALLKEQEAEKKCCKDCEYYGNCHEA